MATGDDLLRHSLKAKPAGFCPHNPWPRQKAFLALDCLEALYGGAAGGGKSDAILMAALQYVHVPGYRALLLRRTYPDLSLPGAIMDRSKEWLMGTGAEWHDLNKCWSFPSGAKITFGYLDTERDKYRYQGAELQFVGFDELTQFPAGWYLYLFSRLRRIVGQPVPLRMRGATNPGGIGHEWVKKRFIDEPGDRVFVPALIDDNPSIDRESYVRSLDQLDPVTRAQLLEGRWLRDSSGLVFLWDGDRNGIDIAPAHERRVLGIDFGYTDSTAFAVMAWPKHSRTVTVVESFKRPGLIPSACAEEVTRLDAQYKFDRIVGDIGGLGKGYAEEMRQRFGIPIEPAEKQNKLGYISLLNGALARGELLVVKPRNQELIRELEELPWNEERTKAEEGFEDHLCDAMLYGWRAAAAWNESDPPDAGPAYGSPEWRAEQARKAKEQAIAESIRRAARENRRLYR